MEIFLNYYSLNNDAIESFFFNFEIFLQELNQSFIIQHDLKVKKFSYRTSLFTLLINEKSSIFMKFFLEKQPIKFGLSIGYKSKILAINEDF